MITAITAFGFKALAFGGKALANKYVRYGLAIAALFLSLWAWGNSRYNDGVEATDAKWVEAGLVLEMVEMAAALAADAEKAARDEEFAEDQSEIADAVDSVKTDEPVGAGVSEYFRKLKEKEVEGTKR